MGTRPAFLLLLAAVLAGCAAQRFEPPAPLPVRSALPPQPDDAFVSIESALLDAHGAGTSGFELLDRNEDGLRWRLALLDSARHSIDAQYYLWYGDASGLLMLARLLDAADRGVKVRLLLDDINALLRDAGTIKLRDQGIALLESHPNIEIRLFNPWSRRGLAGRAGEALGDMKRLNQRMHHKQLIVDNRAVIVGGRNIGDEYLGLHEEFNFHDLDVLGIGPVARMASGVFDMFWNTDWVLPASAIVAEVTAAAAERAGADMTARLVTAKSLQGFAVEPQDWTHEIEALSSRLHAGTCELLTDVPAAGGITHEMRQAMNDLAAGARRELLIVNAYIIPVDETIERMRNLGSRGVRIRILTNSLASHDVPAVNSHYKQWRDDILAAGAELYEVRPDAAIQARISDTPPVRARFMGLHSKAMVIDRERSYIGSMNFDPRSAAINTEMGVEIESAGLADELARLIERDMEPANSWQLRLNDAGKVIWVSDKETLDRQPARNWWQRVQDAFFMLFPKDLY
jgi:putative cardiolipin synthase